MRIQNQVPTLSKTLKCPSGLKAQLRSAKRPRGLRWEACSYGKTYTNGGFLQDRRFWAGWVLGKKMFRCLWRFVCRFLRCSSCLLKIQTCKK